MNHTTETKFRLITEKRWKMEKRFPYNTSVKSFSKAFLYCNHIVMYFEINDDEKRASPTPQVCRKSHVNVI